MPRTPMREASSNPFVDGVTRATRVADLLPGQLVRVEVVGPEPQSVAGLPTVGDLLPQDPGP